MHAFCPAAPRHPASGGGTPGPPGRRRRLPAGPVGSQSHPPWLPPRLPVTTARVRPPPLTSLPECSDLSPVSIWFLVAESRAFFAVSGCGSCRRSPRVVGDAAGSFPVPHRAACRRRVPSGAPRVHVLTWPSLPRDLRWPRVQCAPPSLCRRGPSPRWRPARREPAASLTSAPPPPCMFPWPPPRPSARRWATRALCALRRLAHASQACAFSSSQELHGLIVPIELRTFSAIIS